MENARRHKVQLKITNLDWRELTKRIPEKTFDAVLCLGNSLTCLFGYENQLSALREFYIILKYGGVLIIDERNYERILDIPKRSLKEIPRTSGKFILR